MLQALSHFYRHSDQTRLVPQWDLFVNSLKPQQDVIIQRHSRVTLQYTDGFLKLRRILREADLDFLVKQDNFYIYSTQINRIVNEQSNLFDLARSGRAYTNLFVHSTSRLTNEYLVSLDDNDSLKYLPMVDDYSAWKNIRPLKLWWHDSEEYNLNFMTGYFTFLNEEPRSVLWLLDMPALILKAVNWYRKQPNKDVLIDFFIRDEILIPVLKDLIDLWYIKIHLLTMNIVLGKYPKEQIDTLYVRSQSQWGSMGSRFKEICNVLIDYYTKVSTSELHPRAALSCKFFNNKTTSIRDIIFDIPIKYDISHQPMYEYLRLIRDLPYLEYLLKIYQIELIGNPGSVEFKNLIARLNTLLTKWKNKNPIGMIKNTNHRAFVKSRFDYLYEETLYHQ